jgi:hypothetical protein
MKVSTFLQKKKKKKQVRFQFFWKFKEIKMKQAIIDLV